MPALKPIFKAIGIPLVCIAAPAAGVWVIRSINSRRFAAPKPPAGGDDRILKEEGVSRIDGRYMKGFHLTPLATGQEQQSIQTHPGTVIVFGGSDGGANVEQARMLRDAGYDVLALYFFGKPGQKEFIDEVPLEFFDEVLAYAEEHGNGSRPLTVIGTSKGAELTGNLAARYPQIDNIVLYTPAHHTYGSLTYQRGSGSTSSFSWHGEPVPFAKLQGKEMGKVMLRFALGLPVSYRAGYEADAAAASPESAINLSNFQGNGLLFAGAEDAMWQGDVAAEALAAQNENLEPHIYEGAGHLFHESIDELIGPSWETMMGGTIAANREAKVDSDRILLEHLKQWHAH